MKKIIATALLVFLSLSLFACGGGGKKEEDTTAKSDWRNTIQYEGAFYVNEKLRVLYAFDKGTVTLWDNGGDGTPLQTISYDSTVSDAIERIEKEDFNNDGNRDIRIIYSENEEGIRYNLFLWSEKTRHFAECRTYNEITDPVCDPNTGNVIGVWDKGAFGTVTKEFKFNESSGLDEVSCVISGADGIASSIAKAVGGSDIRRAEGIVSVGGVECAVYIASNAGTDIAYICHTPDSTWYVDRGRMGFYRLVEEKEGAFFLTEYMGDAGTAQDLAFALKGEDVDITDSLYGQLDGSDATVYVLRTESGEALRLAMDKRGYWYVSYDGADYLRVNASTGDLTGSEEFELAVP